MMRRAALASCLLLIVACARSEDADTLPVETNDAAPVEPIRSSSGEDRQLAIGEWRQTIQDDVQALEFGPAGAPALFSLRCDERRGVRLQRHGVAPIGDLPMMIVTIGAETRRLAVTVGQGPIPLLRATVNPRDPLLPVLAQQSDPIIVRVGDVAPLVLPPSPEIGEFVSLCARGGAAAEEDAAETNQAAAQENEAATEEKAAPAR